MLAVFPKNPRGGFASLKATDRFEESDQDSDLRPLIFGPKAVIGLLHAIRRCDEVLFRIDSAEIVP